MSEEFGNEIKENKIRKRFNSVIYDKSYLDIEADKIQDKIQHTRDLRIETARKITNLQNVGGSRNKRRNLVEQEILKQNKKEIYENILEEILLKNEKEGSIKKIELEQRSILLKLEEIAKAKKNAIDLNDVKHSINEITKHFDPLLKYLNNVESANEIIHNYDFSRTTVDATPNNVEINTQITNDLQFALREIHSNTNDDILKRRKELIQTRFQVEERLSQLRRSEEVVNNRDVEDEDFEVSYNRAANMESVVYMSISNLNDGLIKIEKEMEWLKNNPQTQYWKNTEAEIQENIEFKQTIIDHFDNLNSFLNCCDNRVKLIEDERQFNIFELFIKEVAVDIFYEVLNDQIMAVCKEMGNIIISILTHLDSVMMKSICLNQVNSLDLETLDQTGKQSVYLGGIKDFRRISYKDGVVNIKNNLFYKISRSQQLVSYRERKNLTQVKYWPSITQHVDSAIETLYSSPTDNLVDKELLKNIEIDYWKKVSLKPSLKTPILFPKVSGQVIIFKIFPKLLQKVSLLICGTQYGRLVIWSIPWSGDSPSLVAVTPNLPRNERSKVIDIKEGISGSGQIISLLESGYVRVWLLNSISKASKKPSHSFFMFPMNSNEFPPNAPSCLFAASPLDMNLPTSLHPSIMNATEHSFLSNVNMKPQTGTKPTSIIFHPSLTILGRHTSILIGTEGGDMIKFNMDAKINTNDCKIVYNPPFVNLEYVHPADAAPGSVLVSGNDNKKGNSVYRELFHFHKSKIVFIEIIMRKTNYIMTIDEKCVLAIWNYSSDYFEGKSWFRPQYTSHLDFQMQDFEPTCKYSLCEDDKIPKRELLTSRRKSIEKSGKFAELFYPYVINDVKIEFKSISVIKDGPCKWFSRTVTEIIMTSSIDHITPAYDGSCIYFLISYTNDKKNTTSSDAVNKTQNTIIGFNTDILLLEAPYVTFQLGDITDSIEGFHIGPVLKETLTRFAIIQTRKSGLRIFSLNTSQEIITDKFPFFPNLPLPSFSALLSALCPSQRVLVFGGVTDPRVAVYIFTHEDDNGIHKLDNEEEKRKERSMIGLKHSKEYHEKFSINTVQNAIFYEDFTAKINNKIVAEIINGLLNNVFEMVDRRAHTVANKVLTNLITRVYGYKEGNLGIIEPSVWPCKDK